MYIHRVNYFRRSVHRVNAISQHDWLLARSLARSLACLLAWLTGWNRLRCCKAERTNERRSERETARRETGQLEPELCYRGAGPAADDVGSPGQLERYADPRCTLLVKYCTIKRRTHRSQSIPSLSFFLSLSLFLFLFLASFIPSYYPPGVSVFLRHVLLYISLSYNIYISDVHASPWLSSSSFFLSIRRSTLLESPLIRATSVTREVSRVSILRILRLEETWRRVRVSD